MRNSMSIMAILVLSIFSGIFQLSASTKLSEEEALNIINKHLGYPKAIFTPGSDNIEGSKCVIAIRKLVADGYLRENREKVRNIGDCPFGGAPDYIPTANVDQNALCGIVYNPYGKYFSLYGRFVKQEATAIDEILLDNKNDIAVVSFIIGYKPVEPVHSRICKEGQCKECEQFNKSRKEKIKLKKYDKGWRIYQE